MLAVEPRGSSRGSGGGFDLCSKDGPGEEKHSTIPLARCVSCPAPPLLLQKHLLVSGRCCSGVEGGGALFEQGKKYLQVAGSQ